MRELLLGISIGFSAGVAPGPLLALVLTTTLRSGFRAGARVALSPLITDGPIILLAVLLVSALPDRAQDALTVAGGLFVLYLGVETIRGAGRAELAGAAPPTARQDLLRGALVNALSPHPWLFWIGVGAPIITRAWHDGPHLALAFLAGFYGLLIGSKVVIALLAAAGRGRLTMPAYRRLLLLAGALLLLNGTVLIAAALR